MKDNSTHVLDRCEYDAARDLIGALIENDRRRFDESLVKWGADRPEIHADLTTLALRVAEVFRYRYPFFHLRPSTELRSQFVETLAASEFADLVDPVLARIMLDRLYQRAFRDPLIPSTDLISMTTCLAVCAWTLWNRWALFPRDPTQRWEQRYRGTAAGMRLRRFGTYELFRSDPAEPSG